MASTYSALKIQLMTTGENSGTWGNVTNVNLGTALEEAIVGSADVTFASTTVTLALTDSNASQTARNLRLNLIGTSGGAQNLIVPAIEKVYIVNNGCADAITVKNSSGSGIAVPAGKTMWVYNTGSNVVDVSTHLTSLTLGAALPIASGGTGSTSTTYCNLQTNVTGTLPNSNTTASASNGASTIVARDASGNFTAAVITATSFSGSGASLTSLNASNITSGILDVTDGGTGSNTAAGGATNLGLGTSSNVQHASFGVGTAASGTAGEIRATNNITAYYSSDAKFKENVRVIDDATAKVSAIGGKYFDWTDAYISEHGGEDGYFIQKADFGVIAQDVQAVFPQAIRTRPDSSLAVDYEKLSALAFAAIAELVKRIEVLEAK
jgi:hypothetical protein